MPSEVRPEPPSRGNHRARSCASLPVPARYTYPCRPVLTPSWFRPGASAVRVASSCYGGTMSDTPEGERDPLPASRGRRARGAATTRAARGGNAAAARDVTGEAAGADAGNVAAARGPGRPAPRAEATGRTPARHRIGIRELRQE